MWKDLENFLHYLKTERRYSAHTIQSYQTDLSQFVHYLEDQNSRDKVVANSVDKKDIRRFIEELYLYGLNKRSISRKLSAIKSFFKYLQRIHVIKHNAVLEIHSPKLDKPLPTVLDEEEVRKLMDLPDKSSFLGLRDRAILELLYGCGIRLGELLQLKMKQIHLSNHYILVEGKRQKERILPFGQFAKQALTTYLEKRREVTEEKGESDRVFITPKGKSLYPLAVQQMVKKYLQKISEQDHLSPHVLRHSYATHLLDRGADLLAVKELLGHSSLSTTQIYTHVSMDRLKSVYHKTHPRSERDVYK